MKFKNVRGSGSLPGKFHQNRGKLEVRVTGRGYSGARGTFFWGAEFLDFLEYFSIYVSHDPNFFTVGQNYLRATFFISWSCPYLLQRFFFFLSGHHRGSIFLIGKPKNFPGGFAPGPLICSNFQYHIMLILFHYAANPSRKSEIEETFIGQQTSENN